MSVPQLESTDSEWTIETAIADDLFTRIDESPGARKDKNYGLQRIYDFLIQDDQDACRPLKDYNIDLFRYWLVDDIKDERIAPYSVGSKAKLGSVRIVYEEKEYGEPQGIPVGEFIETFRRIKKLRSGQPAQS
jgi:hypothetical protein